MQVKETKIHGAYEFLPDPFIDHRGTYVELFNQEQYAPYCKATFVQDDMSISSRHVLRGLHGDADTWKLITCLHGDIYFVVLDIRENSPTKNIWQSFVLNEKNYRQVLVPPGCANGHLVMSERAIFHYKQSTYYSKNQFTIRWNDPQYGIWWPITTPILSRRDEVGHYVD